VSAPLSRRSKQEKSLSSEDSLDGSVDVVSSYAILRDLLKVENTEITRPRFWVVSPRGLAPPTRSRSPCPCPCPSAWGPCGPCGVGVCCPCASLRVLTSACRRPSASSAIGFGSVRPVPPM
jgi:hypothetical protein